MTSERPDLKALTSLRGIAAWFVVVFHLRRSAGDIFPEWLMDIIAKGYLAVDFFFLLSGFVIWLSYVDRLRNRNVSVPKFLGRRFARIYPLHFVVLCGGVAFALLLAATGSPNPAEYPFDELPLHFLLIQNWGFIDKLSWNDPAWSISVEMAAYLLFPVVVVIVDWRKVATPILLGTLLMLALALYLYFGFNTEPWLGSAIERTGLLRCLVQFFMGTIICALWLRWRNNPKLPGIAALAASAMFAVLAIVGPVAETLVIPLCFASILLAAALFSEAQRNPLRNRPLHYFGEISYATYLSHFLLFVAYKIVFTGDDGQLTLGTFFGFLLLTFVVSAALYHAVERPAQKKLNALFESLSARRAKMA